MQVNCGWATLSDPRQPQWAARGRVYAEHGRAESGSGWAGVVRLLRGYERLRTGEAWLLNFEDGAQHRLVTLDSVAREHTASGERAMAFISAYDKELPPPATELGGD